MFRSISGPLYGGGTSLLHVFHTLPSILECSIAIIITTLPTRRLWISITVNWVYIHIYTYIYIYIYIYIHIYIHIYIYIYIIYIYIYIYIDSKGGNHTEHNFKMLG